MRECGAVGVAHYLTHFRRTLFHDKLPFKVMSSSNSRSKSRSSSRAAAGPFVGHTTPDCSSTATCMISRGHCPYGHLQVLEGEAVIWC